MSKLILGKVVSVDSSKQDIYGHMIASVKVDGKRLDSLMIRNGWAWNYDAYSKETMLRNCQELAIGERKGLWFCGKENVCAPWVYRQLNSRSKIIYCSKCN